MGYREAEVTPSFLVNQEPYQTEDQAQEKAKARLHIDFGHPLLAVSHANANVELNALAGGRP